MTLTPAETIGAIIYIFGLPFSMYVCGKSSGWRFEGLLAALIWPTWLPLAYAIQCYCLMRDADLLDELERDE